MALHNYRGSGRRGRGYYNNPPLNFVEDRLGRPPRRSMICPDPDTNNYKLHVRSIPKSWTKNTLINVFAKVGQPLNVHLQENSHNAPFKWGFVEFQHFSEARDAISELNNNVVLDNIQVAFARDKYSTDHGSCESVDYNVLDDIIPGSAIGSPLNITNTVNNDQCISFDQETDNNKYIIEPCDAETLNYVEEALFQMVLEHYKEKPHVGKCNLCKKASTLTCSYCGVYYCSDLCQKRDWPEHHRSCQKLFSNNTQAKDVNQRPMFGRESKFESKENEMQSKDNFNSYPKQKFENNHNSREYDSRNKNDRFRDNNNQNAAPRNMFQERKNRFEAEKQNKRSGFADNRGDTHGSSNYSNNFENKKPEASARDNFRGRNVQGSQTISEKPSAGIEFISMEQEFKNNIEKQETLPNAAKISKVETRQNHVSNVTRETEKPQEPAAALEHLSLDRLECGRLEVVVQAQKSGDLFYVQVARYQEEVAKLDLALNDPTIETKVYSPVENGVCKAQYDGVWFRSKIIKLNPLEIIFVDYGNTELVKPEELFAIPEEHFTKPPFAVKIKLAEGSPSGELEGFSIKPVKKMSDFWLVEVDGVDYTKSNQTAQETSVAAESSDVTIAEKNVSGVSNTNNIPSTKDDVVSEPCLETELKAGTVEEVVINFVVAEGRFFVIPIVKNEMFTKMMNAITELQPSFTPYTPVLGGVCAASYEGIWCRCKVISLSPLEIQYIDFGNKETLEPNRLFTLPPEYVATPPVAIEIKLAEGTPDAFMNKTYEDKLRIIPTMKRDTFWEVEIEGVEYAKLSVNSTPQSTNIETPPSSSQIGETSKSNVTTKNFERLAKPDPLSSGDLIFICKVIDSCTVLVTPANDQAIEQQIQIECSKNEEQFLTHPKVGDYVAFSMERDGVFFRSRIDKIDSSKNEYEVYNIDCGSKNITKLEQLHPLPAALCNIPCQATEVKLKGLKKLNQTEEFKKYIKNIVEKEEPLKIAFEPVTNLATLAIQESNKIINEDLEYFLEFKIGNEKFTLSSLPEKVWPKNQPLTLMVANSDPLYVQLQEDLKSYTELEAIISEYVESEKYLYNPCVGELCIANPPEFGEWYRCVCLKEAAGRMSTLKLIDFGNVVEVPTTVIRKITQEMLSIAAMGKACKIKDLPEDKSPELQKELNECILPVYSFFDAVIEGENDGLYLISAPSVISSLKEKKLM